jgi:hypothetical protein
VWNIHELFGPTDELIVVHTKNETLVNLPLLVYWPILCQCVTNETQRLQFDSREMCGFYDFVDVFSWSGLVLAGPLTCFCSPICQTVVLSNNTKIITTFCPSNDTNLFWKLSLGMHITWDINVFIVAFWYRVVCMETKQKNIDYCIGFSNYWHNSTPHSF